MQTKYWVHDLDPIFIHFTETAGIRYYGMAYALAFLFGWIFLSFLRKKGRNPLNRAQQENTFFALVLGVMLGARLGFVVLYALPEMLREPWRIIAVWEGGMSSHGGFIGVFLAGIWVSRRYKVRFFRLGDMFCLLAPVGLMLGRVANFINGELWGTITKVPWAVIFPHSAPPGTPIALIPPRHPSQLYEAALEGLFLILYTQLRFWTSRVGLRPGKLCGEFFLLYAVVRILGEQFREPDASLFFGMSRGVFYSIFLGLAGIFMIVYALKRPAEPWPEPAPEPEEEEPKKKKKSKPRKRK